MESPPIAAASAAANNAAKVTWRFIGRAPERSVLWQVFPRGREVRTIRGGIVRKSCELLIVRRRFILVAHRGGRLCGADESVQAVRLLLNGRFEGGERLARHAAFKQHDAIKFARWLGEHG